MYFDKLVKIRDLRKPTIAAVQGTCSAAGLMLASMCDLIIAADDARFTNPVLRMSGVGVELLVEPWELGPRKAKEFLFCAQEFGAAEAERYGLVNRVVPARGSAERRERDGRAGRARPAAHRGRRSRPRSTTWSTCMGQRESWRYHFMLHQFVLEHADRARQDRSRARPAAWTRSRRNRAVRDAVRARRAPGPRSRHADRRAVLRGPARRAGRRGHQDRTTAPRRLHARDRAVRRRDGSLLAVLGGRGTGPQERHARPAHARGPGPLPPARRDRRRRRRELPAGHARALAHRARRPRRTARHRAHLDVRPGRPVLRSGPASTASASATAGCCTSPAIPTARRCASASRSPTTSPASSPRTPRSRRCTRATRAAGSGAVDRRRALRRRCCGSSSGRCPRTTGSASSAAAKATASPNSAPLDNYPTARRQVRLHRRGLRRELRPALQGDGPARSRRRSALRRAWPIAPRTATRSTASSPTGPPALDAADRRGALRRPRRAGRDRVHVGRHLRRPALRRARRPRDGRRSRSSDRCASRRRTRGSSARRRPRRRARPGSASTPTRCSSTLLGLVAADDRRAADEGGRVSTTDVRPVQPGCSSRSTTARSR